MPTSLTYIVLSTRGFSPWRPDAVMSTARRANTKRVSLGFSRAVEKAPDTPKGGVLYQLCNPISRQTDSRVRSC